MKIFLIIVAVLLVVLALIYVGIGLIQDVSERRGHNDRDYDCRYWWGDRGGYDFRTERCSICNPDNPYMRPWADRKPGDLS